MQASRAESAKGMRWTQAFFPTLKETPAEAQTANHQLMLRAGMMRPLASGIYTYLPLGLRVMDKISQIIREELNRVGSQELLMPVLHPAALWQKTGRWDKVDVLFKLKDRSNRDMLLGPTHEEVITSLVAQEVKSYRQLPLLLYQIQTKFRDEPRPRGGVIRGREFQMMDLYSFHRTKEDLEKTYWSVYEAYLRIFKRSGFEIRIIEGETGDIGGDVSHQFELITDAGEDTTLLCSACDYGRDPGLEGSSKCPKCGEPLQEKRGIELGQTFNLGTLYSEPLGCTYLEEDGTSKPMVMGCYGIGVSRLMASAIEQHHDEHGIKWPVSIAPYDVVVSCVNINEKAQWDAALNLYNSLAGSGLSVVLDDRDARAGVKFKDADLIGFPYRVTVGEKIAQGNMEIRPRETGETLIVPAADVVKKVEDLRREALKRLEPEPIPVH